jgi:hypothetical protein
MLDPMDARRAAPLALAVALLAAACSTAVAGRGSAVGGPVPPPGLESF